MRGVTCLHASAVAIGERAVAFVGEAGAGKSTTVAALARKGYAVVSDDIVALEDRDGQFFVTPAYPYICLWPESVVALYGTAEALPKFAATYEKRCLSLPREALRFASEPMRLACVYLLGPRGDRAANVEAVAGREAFVTLVANSYATNLLDSEMRAREFEALGRLMQSVPVRRLTANADAARIDELCERIRMDVESIP
jgi:ABC-type dipeptide/oligopeptide/nickel transport system ATPase component